MGTKVFKRGCRFDSSSRAEIEAEMERGRRYYNDMIGALNRDIAGIEARDGVDAVEGKAKRIERLCRAWFADGDKAKSVAAKAIYRRIKTVSRNIRADKRFSALNSGCYRGTYHAVQADFDRAVSAKRVGVWPGEPYRYRRPGGPGACVGVHIQPPKPWSWVLSGVSEICSVTDDNGRIFEMTLKVSKSSTIPLTVDRGKKCQGARLDIPADALVSHVMVFRSGDYATGGKYEIHVTYKEEDASCVELSRVGVDIGWKRRTDGSMLVAVSSDGRECVIPAYAVRMASRVAEIQSDRDNLANDCKTRLLAAGRDCQAKSSAGVARWAEQYADQSEREYIANERALRCTQEHVRSRYQNIRNDTYRKFVNELRGRACIIKTRLKVVAEEKLKGEGLNFDRVVASCFELSQLFRNAGAVEVACERRGHSVVPDAVNAEEIRLAHESGKLLDRGARKTVRMYRKSKKAA